MFDNMEIAPQLKHHFFCVFSFYQRNVAKQELRHAGQTYSKQKCQQKKVMRGVRDTSLKSTIMNLKARTIFDDCPSHLPGITYKPRRE